MKTYYADLQAMQLIQFTSMLTGGLLALAAGLTLYRWPVVMWCAAGICGGAALLFSLLFLPLWFRQFSCIVTSSQITRRTGIFFRREQSVRLQTIQFVQIVTGPFDGRCGMNFILLHVYGGRMLLPCLRQEDRIALTEYLRAKGVYHAL